MTLQVQGLTVQDGNRTAVQDVSLTVEPGKVTAVIEVSPAAAEKWESA